MVRTFLRRRRALTRARPDFIHAFTLLELMAVIIIMGILAVVAVPTYSKVITNSTLSRDTATLNALVTESLSLAAGAGGGIPTSAEVTQALGDMPALSGGAAWTGRQTSTSNPNPSTKYGQVSYDVTDSTTLAGFAMVASNGDCIVDLLKGGTPIPWSYNYPLAFCDGTIAFAGPNQPNPAAASATNTGSEGPGGYAQTAGTPPTGAPTGVIATATGTNATVSWNPVGVDFEGSGPITGYTAIAVPLAGSPTTLQCTTASTTCTIPGLVPGVIYAVTVTAQNVYGSGPASSPAQDIVTVSAPIAAPITVTAVAGTNDNATITWVDVPANENGGSAITSYTVSAVQDATRSCITGGSATTCTVSGLTGGSSYTFTVTAASASGSGPASSPSNAITAHAAPSVPTNVVGSQASTTSINLTWSAPSANGSPITNYAIQYSANGGSSWTTYTANTHSTATTATLSGLTTGTSYLIQVDATNAIGTSSWSASSPSLTLTDAPVAPTAPSATAIANTGLSVTWSAPFANGSPITGYELRYSSNGGTSWTIAAANTGSTSTSATISGLTAGATYVVQVAAINAVNTGAYSPSSTSVKLPTVPTAPAAPTASQLGAGALTLNWSAPSSNGSALTGYAIRYSSNGGSTWTVFSSNTGSTSTIASVTGLSANTSYVEEVAGINAYGTGSWSPASNAVVFATSPATPAAPTISEATSTSLSASWSAPSNNGSAITGYALRYSTNAGTTWTVFSSNTGSTVTNATITGLTAGTTYVVDVAAINVIGAGGYSTTSNSLTLATVPSAPAAPTATDIGATSIQATWVAPSNGYSAITGYAIRYSANAGSTWTTFTSNTASTATTATVTGLTTGTSYVIQVAAINAIGTGSYSPSSNSVLTATVPSAPAAPTATLSGLSSVALSWATPANGGSAITGYAIQYSSNGGTSWTTFSSNANSSATSATITGLTPGSSYVEEVAAINAVGTGPWSPLSNSVTTPNVPNAPTALSATGADNTAAFTESWTAPSNNGSAITDYLTQYSTSPLGPWTTVDEQGTAPSQALTVGTTSTYYVEVAATNAVGTGPWSSPDTVTWSQTSDPIYTYSCTSGDTLTNANTGNCMHQATYAANQTNTESATANCTGITYPITPYHPTVCWQTYNFTQSYYCVSGWNVALSGGPYCYAVIAAYTTSATCTAHGFTWATSPYPNQCQNRSTTSAASGGPYMTQGYYCSNYIGIYSADPSENTPIQCYTISGSAAAGGPTYSCNADDTLSGTTCTTAPDDTTAYAAGYSTVTNGYDWIIKSGSSQYTVLSQTYLAGDPGTSFYTGTWGPSGSYYYAFRG